MGDTKVWSPTQQARLAEWGVPRCVDIHCHCLPGVDDGPATTDDALDLCDALVADGITTVIATPHQLGGYDRQNTAATIRAAVNALATELAAQQIPLELAPGADVRVDERLPRLLESDVVVTPADARRHVLLELPHELFVDPMPAIVALSQRGLQTIMTHPERHRYLSQMPDRIISWIDAGAVLQVTAGSLLGHFGARANDEAWRLVHAGLVSLVATDAHDAERRPPCLTLAIDALAQELGRDAARVMCLENPWRVLQGQALDVPRTGAT
jgi:protein-tyrosine phosphatase